MNSARIVPNFAKLLSDSDDGVRLHGYSVFINIQAEPNGLASVLSQTELFIKKVVSEKDNAVKVIFAVFHRGHTAHCQRTGSCIGDAKRLP